MNFNRFAISYDNFIIASILTSTLTAYAIIPTVPATVPCYLLILLFIPFYVVFPKDNIKYQKTINQFTVFVSLFALYAVIAQISNWLLPVTIPQTIILIESSNSSPLLLRSTLFTQSAYLIVNVFLYLAVKNYAKKEYLKYIHWTFRILIAYGLYEFVYYLIFGANGDFVSNRVFTNDADDVVGGSFQLQYIGVTTLQRIKGFTGEPSMFSFVILPYFALSVGLRKKWEAAICVFCLIFTFSTTAYIGLLIAVAYWIVSSPDKKLRFNLILATTVLIVLFLILLATNEIVQEVVDVMFVSKFNRQSMSGDERAGLFEATFNFWKNSDILHFLFGYGFGYARSTDFFSTLLFNVGLLGFTGFALFIFSHFFIYIEDNILQNNYRLAVLVIFFTMMTSVPEFTYSSIWVILASGYVLKTFNGSNAEGLVTQQVSKSNLNT